MSSGTGSSGKWQEHNLSFHAGSSAICTVTLLCHKVCPELIELNLQRVKAQPLLAMRLTAGSSKQTGV